MKQCVDSWLAQGFDEISIIDDQSDRQNEEYLRDICRKYQWRYTRIEQGKSKTDIRILQARYMEVVSCMTSHIMCSCPEIYYPPQTLNKMQSVHARYSNIVLYPYLLSCKSPDEEKMYPFDRTDQKVFSTIDNIVYANSAHGCTGVSCLSRDNFIKFSDFRRCNGHGNLENALSTNWGKKNLFLALFSDIPLYHIDHPKFEWPHKQWNDWLDDDKTLPIDWNQKAENVKLRRR